MASDNIDLVRTLSERFIETEDVAWDLLDPDVEVFDHDMP